MAEELFSQYLRRKRRERGLSQEELAELAGVSANYIARLETDSREPGLRTLMKITKALDLSADEVIKICLNSFLKTV